MALRSWLDFRRNAATSRQQDQCSISSVHGRVVKITLGLHWLGMAARDGAKSARNHYVLIVFDSCRYDSFLAARPRTMRKLGKVERRRSYASWAGPSHYKLLLG